MSDEKSVYPRIKTGHAQTKDMNDELVQKFNNQTSHQGSAFLKINFYKPKKLIVRNLPVKKGEKM